jgi:hypothetical protein
MSKFDSPDAAPDRTGKKVVSVLKFRDGGLSVEDAKKAMLAAGEAPSGMVARPAATVAAAPEPIVPAVVSAVVPPAVGDVIEGDFEDEIEAPKAAAPAVVAPVVVPPAVPQRIERVENDKFIGEIKQENGKWVAELRYKAGSGTERFIADTKSLLMMKLLEGKGHATLRVNKAVRREKLGWSELDRQYPLPEGITADDFDKMSDKQQDHLLLTVATQQTLAFREAHPEFYRTDANAQKLNALLNKEKLPITLRNLEYALDELTADHLPLDVRLEERPSAVAPATPSLEQPAPAAPPARTDPAPAVAAPAPVPTVAAAAAPGVTVRKRGMTGLRPTDSSSEPEPAREDDREPRQLSEAELKKMPMSQLQRIVRSEQKQSRAQR